VSATGLFWLHVPLETTRGDWLKPPGDGRVTVLGKPARLLERDLPAPNSLASANTAVVKQWLLFDPLPESDAKLLLKDLRARFPVLALRQSAALRVGASALHVSPYAMYNGPIPTLIPAHFTPSPIWAEATTTSYIDGLHALEVALNNCPSVTDDRVLAALELAIASRYDVLPRSVFLAQLTILDSLAERKERPAAIKEWLDHKIAEAQSLNDIGLISSLGNLKRGSHGGAVRELVSRAACASGLNPTEQKKMSDLASDLYRVRSSLSHAGGSTNLDIEGARRLVSLVLNAAISNPSVLDAESP
jgi:hypothetical protein